MPQAPAPVAEAGPVIVLRSISKAAGKSQFRRILLQDVNWIIGPLQRIAILGHPSSGALPLLDIIGGQAVPTTGWVERRATLSGTRGLLRYAGLDTPRQLIARLSRLYRMDPKEITAFVAAGLGRADVLDLTPRALPNQLRQQLNTVLTLAFPFDFYLFQTPPVGNGDQRFQAFCAEAVARRSREAGVIVRVSSSRAARKMDGEMLCALVYRGNMTLYRRLTDAISVFDSLPPEEGEPLDDRDQDTAGAEPDIDLF